MAQLGHLGVDADQVRRWAKTGDLIRVLPRVYAVGHSAPSVEAELFEAVLYAGPGAMLSHGTAAWWRGLIEYPVPAIHVSTPREVRSLGRVEVHARRTCVPEWHRGITVTSIVQTLLDLAAGEEPRLVRKALGRLDFRHELDAEAMWAACRRGVPGSRVLRGAVLHHEPRLDRADGRLEYDFLEFCERHGIPLPGLVNQYVHGVLVDAYWPEARLDVELDGVDNHSSPAQLRRDRRNELTLRSHGIEVVRYDWELVHNEPLRVRDDILAQLVARRAPAPALPTGRVPRARSR